MEIEQIESVNFLFLRLKTVGRCTNRVVRENRQIELIDFLFLQLKTVWMLYKSRCSRFV